MRPMGRLALGLALVWLNFHVGGLDLLANPVGWVIAALALRQVADRHPMLVVAAWCAAAAAALSVVTWVPVWGAPPRPPTPLVAIEGLLAVAVVVTVCTALVDVLADVDPAAARQAGVIRWLDPAIAVASLAVTGAVALQAQAVTDAGSGPLAGLVVALVVTGLAVRLWFLVLVVRHGDPLVDDGEQGRPPRDGEFGVVEEPGQSSGW